MSYTKSFDTVVPYSGTKACHYPASKNGGTRAVSYSGSVPVHVTIKVDTAPFDQSVSATKGSLAVVAGALTAAQAAQVAQIRSSADQVADAAVTGVFKLLLSELSSETSEFANSCSSQAAMMVELASEVDRTHEQMEADYQAIKGRYLKIFEGLDAELSMRVRELDRPVFALGESATHGVFDPFRRQAPDAVMLPHDVSATQTKLTCASEKRRVSGTIRDLATLCDIIDGYEASVSGIWEHGSSGRETGRVYLPVVVSMRYDPERGSTEVVVSGNEGDRRASVGVETELSASGLSDEGWGSAGRDDRNRVTVEFERLLAEYATAMGGDEASQRTCALIQEMFYAGAGSPGGEGAGTSGEARGERQHG